MYDGTATVNCITRILLIADASARLLGGRATITPDVIEISDQPGDCLGSIQYWNGEDSGWYAQIGRSRTLNLDRNADILVAVGSMFATRR